MRRRGAVIVAAAIYLVLAGWSTVVFASFSARRTITVICSSIEEVCREWATGFTTATGTEVVMVRMSSGQALARLSRPGGLSDFDIWHGGPAEAYELAKERGLLLQYHSPDAESIPPAFRDADGYWTGVYLGVLGFCSNTAVLGRLGVEPPTRWDDLLSARLADQISVPSPVTSGTGYTLLWTTRLRTGSVDAAAEYLKALDGRVLQYTSSGMAPARVAGRGEVAVGVGFTQHCLRAEKEGFTDLTITYPSDGTGFEIGSVAVLRDSHDPEAARSYVDYAVSASAQSLGGQLPTRKDVAVDDRLGAGARRLVYKAAQAADEKATLTSAVLRRVR